MAMHPSHRTLASIPARADPRGTNRSTYRAAFVVWIAEPVGTRGIAVLASRMAAAAGIGASGIVGAYFESGQPWRRHSRNSSFSIIENGGFRQET
ncbi:hypothetical protein LGM42_19320 [Burkholderia sp. AU39826]|uniref:hypothetical protein n=1 Tax=Burkholderia sp. AU39826 TaxID=2879634 RepID=UPI001CF1E81E|nr:hypothetical protein [Burkholderia sp. AU39826]MCA7972024.1 hypothetical protein [Burkholderia sp. AU39826]